MMLRELSTLCSAIEHHNVRPGFATCEAPRMNNTVEIHVLHKQFIAPLPHLARWARYSKLCLGL